MLLKADGPVHNGRMNTATRPKRRFLQFRLRTLLLLFAVASTWLGWKVHQAEKQRQAVAAIRSIIMPDGGWVRYDYEDASWEESAVWQWWRNYLGSDMLHDVVSVGIRDVDIRGLGLHLREDQLQEALVRLREFPSLRNLSLRGTRLTDQHLKHVGRLTRLRRLEVFWGEFSDDGLPHLAKLKHLTRLELDYTAVTQDGIDRLQRALPNCYIEW